MKKLISVFLSVLILFGCLCVPSLATDSKLFYVALGDSIAYGSGLSNPVEACYGKIIADTNAFDFANHAIPGHTTTNLINRLSEETVIDDIKKADIISISIGGNDFLTSNLISLMFDALVKNNYGQFDTISENFYKNLCTIIDTINEYNSDAVILLQTIYNPQSGVIGSVYQQGADRLNTSIIRYAEENPGEIVVVDVAAALGDDAANFADDGIHPSAQGNELIAAEIQKTLYELGFTAGTETVITENGSDIIIPFIFTMGLEIFANIFRVLGAIRNMLTGTIAV